MRLIQNSQGCSSELSDIIESTYIEPREVVPELQSEILMCAVGSISTFVYGAGKDIDIFIRYLMTSDVNVCGVIDRDKEKWGSTIEGIPVISTEKFAGMGEKSPYVFIYTLAYKRVDKNSILAFLIDNNIKQFYFLNDFRYDVAGFLPQHAVYYEDRRRYYKEHIDDLLDAFDMYKDDNSRKVMMEYIRSFIECDFYRGIEIATRYKYFYDESKKEIYRHLVDEVWVNCGAESGGTIAEYGLNGLKAKTIFAVEPERDNLDTLKKNLPAISNFSKEIRIVEGMIDGSGKAVKEIVRYHAGKITLINADIEGYESDLIDEFADIIRTDRPVLALCAYHKKEDLIVLPQKIMSLSDSYRFFLRKYAGWLRGDSRRCLELVMYAVPRERIVCE